VEQWFVNRRKSKVLDLAYRQMTLAIDTVNELEKSIIAASKRNKEKAKKCVERLFPIEEEIDNLRRSVFEELTRGSLPSNDREDIMHLVKRLDVMADHVKDSSRSVLVLIETEVPEEVWDMYVNMAGNLVDCASTLRKSLEKLGSAPHEARALSQKVDQVEKKVDDEYLVTKSLLLKHGKDVNPATLMILKDLLESMEEVADSCADTADYVKILTVARETA